MLHRRCFEEFWIYQDSEYSTGSEYVRTQNISGFWIYFWIWVCQVGEYTWFLSMPGLHRVLNIPKYVWIIPEYAWLCLNMSEYTWICPNMLEFLNLPESFLFYISPLQSLVYLNVQLLIATITRSYCLKEHGGDLIWILFRTKYFYK